MQSVIAKVKLGASQILGLAACRPIRAIAAFCGICEEKCYGYFGNPVSAMPSTVTAFSVKIVSPGGARMEPVIAREVIGEWNARHGLEQNRILLPLSCEGNQPNTSSDLLIVFFLRFPGSPGVPGEPASEAAEEEIDNQLREGRPPLIYFSEARIDLEGAAVLQRRGAGRIQEAAHDGDCRFLRE